MATVTIAKSYFDAFLRRGEFHGTGAPSLPPSDGVTISQLEYNHLNQQAREYAILRDALIRGGLNQSTLDLLISGASEQQEQDDDSSWEQNMFTRPSAVPVSIRKPSNYQHTPDASPKLDDGFLSQPHQDHNVVNDRKYSYGGISLTSYADKDDCIMPEEADVSVINGNWRTGVPQEERRTILFSNLPERTTHAEITNIVRGGMLLDIYVRNDRTANVSFASGADKFMQYAKRNDIYLRTKRIEVSWNDRQFRMPNHIANKIAAGASRNIVIRNGTSRDITEQGIREDMEHIHNLIVISVNINQKNGDIFISTNSVHNALFARTCMMSRYTYKGLKIEHYPDECAAPIPKTPERVAPPPTTAAANPHASRRSAQQSRGNLYALLASDGNGDESDASSATDGADALLPDGLSRDMSCEQWRRSVKQMTLGEPLRQAFA